MPKELQITPPAKELAEYRAQTSLLSKQADELVVDSQESLDKGADLLKITKEIKRVLTARKEEITRPLMQGLASARDLFKPLEAGPIEAEKIIKAKMLAFQLAEEERIRIDRERIEKRVAKGTMKKETGSDKLEEIEKHAPNAALRTLVKVRIVDESLIPREYLVVDMGKITEAVLRQNAQIPGVERYEEKAIISK